MRLFRMHLPLVIVVGMLLMSPGAAAVTESSTSTAADVSATLSWSTVPNEFGIDEITSITLDVSRAGTPIRTGPISLHSCEEPSCRPFALVGTAADAPRVLVRNVDRDIDAEVLVGAFSGGAHCCTSLTLLDWNGSSYRQIGNDFLDGGVQLIGTGAATTFHTHDGRFSYRFSSFAASWLPFRALRFANGRFVEATRSFPALIRHDAARAWSQARSQCRSTDSYADSLGAYAGWAANRYRLGARRSALATLRSEQRMGCFKGTGAATFIGRLDRYLLRIL